MTITEDIKILLESTKQIAESTAGDYVNRKSDPVILSFWSLCNRIKITEEIMTFYEHSWYNIDFPEVNKAIESELVERVMTVTKDLFVDIVSIIEKAVKDSVSTHINSGIKEESLKTSNYLYLRSIIECSRQKNVLDQITFEEWDSILTMRNLAVHNNSMSDRSKKYTVGSINISMRPGRMMKGPLNTFVVLSSRIIELFYSWIKKINEMF